MTYAVVFNSQTGNTRQIAQAIRNALPPEQCLYYGQPDLSAVEAADLIFAGFWADRGTCDEGTAEFLSLLENKKVALFGTAGFGSSPEYFNILLGRASTHVAKSSTVLGSYMSHGRMPGSLRERYMALLKETPDDPKVKGLVENFDRAMLHPDEGDLRQAGEFAKHVMDSAAQ